MHIKNIFIFFVIVMLSSLNALAAKHHKVKRHYVPRKHHRMLPVYRPLRPAYTPSVPPRQSRRPVGYCAPIDPLLDDDDIDYYDPLEIRRCSARRNGNTTYYYDSIGTPKGSSRIEGNTTYYYDPIGNQQGSARREGNTVYYFDPIGNPKGSSRQEGNTTYYYDNLGTPVGYARSDGP